MAKTISKISGAQDLDYEAMRLDSLALIQKLSGNIWTDFNAHDPGITLLENIIFAISELGYKTDFDIEDYLTSKDGNIDLRREALYTAEQVKECFPVSAEDYSSFFSKYLKGAIRTEFLNCTDGCYEVMIVAKDNSQLKKENAEIALLKSFNELWNDWRLLGENISSVKFLWLDEDSDIEKVVVETAKHQVVSVEGIRRDFLNFAPIVDQFPMIYRKGEDALTLQKFLEPVEFLIKKFLSKIDDFADLFSVDVLKTSKKKYCKILDQMLAMYGMEYPDELFMKIHEHEGETAFVNLLRAKVKYIRSLPALHMHRCGKYFGTRLEIMLGVKNHIVDGIYLNKNFGKIFVVWGNSDTYSEETRNSMEDFVREELPAHLIPDFIWLSESLPEKISASWFYEK